MAINKQNTYSCVYILCFTMKNRIIQVRLEFFSAQQPPHWARASSFTKFLDHTQRRTAFGRTPLDEWSARSRELYLTEHNTQKQTDIHVPGGIRTRNLSMRAAADLRLRTRGHWDGRDWSWWCLIVLIRGDCSHEVETHLGTTCCDVFHAECCT